VSKLYLIQQSIQGTFITPRSSGIDNRRQEFILNIILSTLSVVAIITSVIVTIGYFTPNVPHYPGTFITTLVFVVVVLGLLGLSRLGHVRSASICFIGLMTLVSVQQIMAFSFQLQSALLTCVMVIIIAGVLLPARFGLRYGISLSLVILIIGYLQTYHIFKPDMRWNQTPLYFGDTIAYSGILVIIAVIAWLSNREIDRSLQRARISETALAHERDGLEAKVISRTRELEQAQLVRMMELSRFAEFGRLSANLLHAVTNPLTAASLNLEQATDGTHSGLITQAQRNLGQLERYVQAARKQINREGALAVFNVRGEILEVVNLLDNKLQEYGATIKLQVPAKLTLYGDAVKFSQIVGNLLGNATEAYEGSKQAERPILITAQLRGKRLELIVSDWGHGLSDDDMLRVFEPFFSTKHQVGSNMGIGMAMSKQFVEHDFGGKIKVHCAKDSGTVFTVTVPIKRATKK
jgi:signal transduction histidine kinase